jgi:hypothetical protein
MRCRRPLVFVTGVAVAVFSLLAAGCGGGAGSAGVASVASTTTAGTSTAQNGALDFARCMRSHGVAAFPDPDSTGDLPKLQVVDARKSNPSGFDSANSACRRLLPNGGNGPTITAADRTDYLKAAACMRSHGFSDFPDPTFPNDNVTTDIPSSIDQDSSEFKSAATICTKLIPAGLPYTRPSGS